MWTFPRCSQNISRIIDSDNNWFSVMSLTTSRCTFENVFGWLHFWRRGLCVVTCVCVCVCVCIFFPCYVLLESLVYCPYSGTLNSCRGCGAPHWQLGFPPLRAPCLFNPPPSCLPHKPVCLCYVQLQHARSRPPDVVGPFNTVLALNNLTGLNSSPTRPTGLCPHLENSWALSTAHIHSQ